ncbi:MAG TPA: glycosyltransferase family 4 protein [Patescibacteria group bacterium]|nr:glycosyltransferase family 4 protein [Patescibacteria group bacterium]
MKVTLITMAYPHPRPGFWPGIERQVAGFAAALRDAGAEVSVITSFRNGGPPRETHDGIRIFRVPDTGHRFGRLGYLFNMHVRSLGANALKVSEAIDTADVIETFIPLPDSPALARARLSLFAFFPHRDTPLRWSDYLLHPQHFAMEKRFFRRVRKVIVASAESRRVLVEEYGLAGSSIEVVPLGVSANFLQGSDQVESQTGPRQEADRRPVRLLYVGLLIPRKGLRTLIDALPLLKRAGHSFSLTIAGSGPDRAELQARAAAADVGDLVEFLGRVDDKDLPGLYRSADVFVFPSVKEGFGLVLVEAMACGLPVVASSAPPIPEVVGPAGIFFSPEDPEDLAAALGRVIGDPLLMRRLAGEGRRRVRDEYLWSRVAERTLKIYLQAKAA